MLLHCGMLNYTRQVNWLLGNIGLSLLRSVIYFDDNENGEASSSSLDQSLFSVSWKRQQFVRVSSHSMKRTQPCEILVRPWMVLAQSLRGCLSWNKNKMGYHLRVLWSMYKILLKRFYGCLIWSQQIGVSVKSDGHWGPINTRGA